MSASSIVAQLGRHVLRATRVSVCAQNEAGASTRSEAAVDADDASTPVALDAAVLRLEVERFEVARAARLRPSVRNAGRGPIDVDRIAVVFGLPIAPDADVAFLRNGWQSWSKNTVEPLGEGGDAPFPSGAWLRGMHHAVGERAVGRADWHESHSVTAIDAGEIAVLAGVVETGRQFGLVNARRVRAGDAAGLEVELEWVVERRLEPGEMIELEAGRVALGPEAHRLLEDFATAWGQAAGARTAAPFQAGWCSWYHFFHDITEEALLRNLDALARRRDELPVALVQLDDGYQRAIGDWLETNEKFPSGLPFVAQRIRDAGFEAGLWTAPFSAVRHSRLLEAHPDWALRGDDGEWLRGTLIPQWSPEGWCYALDPSHPAFAEHVEAVHREIVEMGFTYQKLDFLYMAAMRGHAHDAGLGRAERLAAGLDAVRRGAGEDAFLLGCGCPMGPAVGRVDGMRIGPDVAPTWGVEAENVIPGIEPALPATGAAIRSVATRLFMHRRLWLNDPDCLMVRQRETQLTPDEIGCLADAIGASGGMVVFSDDVDLVGVDDAARLRQVMEDAERVDAAAPWGAARLASAPNDGAGGAGDAASAPNDGAGGAGDAASAPNDGAGGAGDAASAPNDGAGGAGDAASAPNDGAGGAGGAPCAAIEADVGRGLWRASLNLADARATDGRASLAPHASRFERGETDRPVAVFCDFDGTFIDRDIGAGLARRHLAAARDALWSRFEAGALDAWTYAVELFTGFELAEAERLAFLDAVEIDPGAERLVTLCRDQGWRFEVLSDGFDANIEPLRARFGFDFAYRANHLEIGDDGWRLAPGGRPVGCACGTGTCKRRAIEALRAEQPDALVVHVGNGRVSDLCGALEADRAFAKDTLGPALDAAGRAHLRFEHLGDVANALETWWVDGR